MSMKNSHDTIGNQTRNLPACSAVLIIIIIISFLCLCFVTFICHLVAVILINYPAFSLRDALRILSSILPPSAECHCVPVFVFQKMGSLNMRHKAADRNCFTNVVQLTECVPNCAWFFRVNCTKMNYAN
jgi:hypothetical protein